MSAVWQKKKAALRVFQGNSEVSQNSRFPQRRKVIVLVQIISEWFDVADQFIINKFLFSFGSNI